MTIKPIKSEEDYQSALLRMEEIFHAEEGSPEGDEAEILVLLIEKFENEHYPIEDPDPIEAIKFMMEQNGLKKKDLAEIIGYKSRVSEILSRKRKLSLEMMRNLHDKLNISYESLMGRY
ncbi:MAG: helix-turn-helix domain-containing protein [Bacteroidota bacterium]